MKPMLAHEANLEWALDLDPELWSIELKFDGFRCIAEVAPDEIRLYSRREKDITASFPEVVDRLQHFVLQVRRARNLLDQSSAPTIFDGELVAYGPSGPKLIYIQKRNNVTRKDKLLRLQSEMPVKYHIFDRYTSGKYSVRKADLLSLAQDGLPDVVQEYPASRQNVLRMWAFVEENGLEGLVIKKNEARYRPGTRTHSWRKVKF